MSLALAGYPRDIKLACGPRGNPESVSWRSSKISILISNFYSDSVAFLRPHPAAFGRVTPRPTIENLISNSVAILLNRPTLLVDVISPSQSL